MTSERNGFLRNRLSRTARLSRGHYDFRCDVSPLAADSQRLFPGRQKHFVDRGPDAVPLDPAIPRFEDADRFLHARVVARTQDREQAGRVFNLIVRAFTGLKIHDTQCGLKLFRASTTRRAFELLRATGFGYDPEVLFLIERDGGRIVEVAIRWDDNPATKLRFLRDSTRMFLDLIALRWRWAKGLYNREN